MAGKAQALSGGSQAVIVLLLLMATVVMLLLAFRILIGSAFLIGEFFVFGLLILGMFLNMRWRAKIR